MAPLSRGCRLARAAAFVAAALVPGSASAVSTAPVMTGLTCVRQGPNTLRLFVSAYDPDADMVSAAVTALDAAGRPLSPPVETVVPLGPLAFGETILSGVSFAVPWTAGDQVGVSVRDSSGLASKTERRWVPPCGGGASPTVTWAGSYRTGPDSLALLISGADLDPEPNTCAFVVRLLSAAGSLIAIRYVEAGDLAGRTVWETRIPVGNLGSARQGVVAALDANGNVSADADFKVPVYGSGTAPVVTALGVRRPLPYRLLVSFSGSDADADEAVGVVEFTDAEGGAGNVVMRYEADFLRNATGQVSFSATAQIDGLLLARSVRAVVRDVCGNCSATYVSAVPAPFAPGDADADGRISAGDAVLACRVAAGFPAPDPDMSARADIDPVSGTGYGGNGLDLADVKAILRIAAGLWEGPPKPR